MKTESTLSLEELEKLEFLCLRLENATTEADRDIENLLADIKGDTRRHFLRELLWQDVEQRQRSGQAVSIADYSFNQPEDQQVVEVVFGELDKESISNGSGNVELPDRYKKIEQVGSGGIGTVLRVYDMRSQRPLALKSLRPKFRGDRHANIRLQREAILTGALQHPGVPPVHDHGQMTDGSVYFAMKLIEGKTLEDILEIPSDNASDLQKKLGIFEKVSQTMAYVHSNGVVHRDLKPQNIMVGKFAEVQVMDWGMAKRLDNSNQSPESRFSNSSEQDLKSDLKLNATPCDDDTVAESNESSVNNSKLTRFGDVLGTPRYMAPEQARGELDRVDTRADVFSLGAILFEILTNTRLYEGVPASEILATVASGKLDAAFVRLGNSGAEAKLISLCQNCLSPDPDNRPEHAGVVAQEMNHHFENVQQRMKAAEIDLRETEVRANEEAKRRKTFSRMLMLVASVFAVGLAGVIWQWTVANANAANYQSAAILAKRNANEFKEAEALAKQRLKESRKIVDEYFTEIAQPTGALANIPGAGELRRRLLKKARDYYVKFVEESEGADDRETRLQCALANNRLGAIIHKLDPASEPAFDALHAGTIELRSLIEEDGDKFDGDHWNALADGLNELARILTAAGHHKDALETHKELVEIRRQLNAEIETDDSMLQLGMAYSNLAGSYDRVGDKEEEYSAGMESIGIGELLLIENGTVPRYLINISKFHTTVGSYYGWSANEWEKAKEHLEIALELVSRDLPFEEFDQEKLMQQRLVHRNIAMVNFHCKDIEASKFSFNQNLKIAEEIANQNPLFPDHEFRLAEGWGNYSTFLNMTGQMEEAHAAHDRHRQIAVALAFKYPTEINFMKCAVAAETQYCDYLDVSEQNTIEFCKREKLLRLYLEHFPNDNLPKQKLACLLGSISAEPNEELLELTSYFDQQTSLPFYHNNSRALALLRNDQHETALEILTAVKESKRYSIWYSIRSLLHIEADQFEAAEACMKKADELLGPRKPGKYPDPYWAFLLQNEIRDRLRN